ncbi:MAG: OmpA family protein [Rhodospirillales bacterium]|jgi:chemotaxis protein MotB|nr:OmpA family protein [Rhodospirillales bacterium]
MAKGGTIVIKRIKKSHAGHHGGAWKVAYADFVTAMMAFFLLLWLLNAVSQEQLEGISDYFAPITTAKSTSGGQGMLQGQTVDAKGVYNSQERRAGLLDQNATVDAGNSDVAAINGDGQLTEESPADESLKELLKEEEDRQFKEAEAALRKAIAADMDLRPLTNSLLIDNTPEGLRFQILDQAGLPMFPRGSPEMYAHTRRLLEQVARVIRSMPQDIAISGHTDGTRYAADSTYTNWELSSDRANAARRMLGQFGVGEQRIARVVGMAATEPLKPHDPDHPGNRRLSLLLIRGSGGDGAGTTTAAALGGR